MDITSRKIFPRITCRVMPLLAILSLSGALSACSSNFSSAPAQIDYLVGTSEVGIASYYSDAFQGRKTASGEPYKKELLTAAHKTLPFGTLVEVKNLSNGQSVIATVNDRGPFTRGRIIDLSQAAASKIGMLAQGVAKVEVVTLKP